tara:strand:- start:2937 stop:3479 length:543 start_codon:yes stop_codon:yes gene_type:complete
MFIQTQKTPNPNSLKFIPGKGVSNDGPYEFLNENQTEIPILKKILSINGVTGIFLSEDFLSINKSQDEKWENIKHIVISYLNEYYEDGSEFIINKNITQNDSKDFGEIEKKIIKILETKIRPAVAKDGGDITFKEFKDGIVTVMLKGSCSGCPSSTLTLKQGVQNLLCHYIPEVKEVLAV